MQRLEPSVDTVDIDSDQLEEETVSDATWKWEVSQRRQREQQFAQKHTRMTARRRGFRRAQQRNSPGKRR